MMRLKNVRGGLYTNVKVDDALEPDHRSTKKAAHQAYEMGEIDKSNHSCIRFFSSYLQVGEGMVCRRERNIIFTVEMVLS